MRTLVLYLAISGLDWIGLSSVLRPRQHSIGYMWDGFYRSKDPTNSIKVLKEMLQRTNQTTKTAKYTYAQTIIATKKWYTQNKQLAVSVQWSEPVVVVCRLYCSSTSSRHSQYRSSTMTWSNVRCVASQTLWDSRQEQPEVEPPRHQSCLHQPRQKNSSVLYTFTWTTVIP